MKWILLIIGIGLFVGCERALDYSGKYPDSKLVMFAFVTPDSAIEVEVDRTFFFGDSLSDDSISAVGDIFVNGQFAGELQVGEERLVSTVRPKVGDHVKIVVRAPGYDEVEGEVTLPERGPQVEVDTFSSQDQRGYPRLNYRIAIKDEGTGRRYYRLIVEQYTYSRIKDEIINPYRSYEFSTENDPLLEGSGSMWFDEDERNRYRIFTNEIFEGKTYVMTVSSGMNYSSVFEIEIDGEKVTQYNMVQFLVRVVNIDKATYQYLKSTDMAERGEGIMEPIQVFSNVKNGVGIVGYANEAVARFVMPSKEFIYTN